VADLGVGRGPGGPPHHADALAHRIQSVTSVPTTLVVTGSLNMDFVVQVERLPAPGETALGHDFRMIPGGKGANQACAAGKLARDARVRMVGRVGYDPFADSLKASLAAAGVDVTAVQATHSQPTGIAEIWVERSGQNSIVVAGGANAELSPADIESVHAVYATAAVSLFQLETPLATVEAALRASRDAGALTVLDPAPARPLPASLLSLVDVLTPNETEACILLGRVSRAGSGLAEAREMSQALRALGPAYGHPETGRPGLSVFRWQHGDCRAGLSRSRRWIRRRPATRSTPLWGSHCASGCQSTRPCVSPTRRRRFR
jgi:ribokinase